jgi:hypothetical protein
MNLITHDEALANVRQQFVRLRDELHCGPSTLKKFIFSIRKARASFSKLRLDPILKTRP